MEALEEKIKAFLTISRGYGYGYGYGSGSGYGYGDGHGSGSGYGHGNGDGDGDGYGYGSGYGDGSGYGSGYGYGDGHGNGDGSGYGYGYGYGILNYNGHKVYMIDSVPTLIYSVHSNYAKGAILKDDLTLQPCFIAKVGNSFAHAETLKKAFADATGKELEN